MLNTILSVTNTDTRSTTGKNLRGIMLLTKKPSIEDIKLEDSELLEYFPIQDEDKWKSELLNLMIDEREQSNFDKNDQELMDFWCSN